MKCPKCNYDNLDAVKYCYICGYNLRGIFSQIHSYERKRRREAKEAQSRLLLNSLLEKAEQGRYTDISSIGLGGSGMVFKAFDTIMKEWIAIKTISPLLQDNPRSVERFHRETRLIRKCRHENIIAVYDMEVIKGALFICMEYVEGPDLKEIIRKAAPLPLGKALNITRQICRGLVYCHARGIIHRDIKPHNILLDKDGAVKIADFGLCKILEDVEITKSGISIGTSGYMSPEAAEDAKRVDPRCDIYSLGAVFYEMLTGKLPKGENYPAPSILNPAVPASWESVILHALAQNPDNRCSSAAALLETLEGLMQFDTDISE